MTHDSESGMPMSERMQSLLSRAVEDQQSEQHSLAGALDDVRSQLATLVHDIESGRSQPAAEHDATAVTALSVELQESTRRTGERLDAVSRMVGQRGEDIAALQNSLAAVDQQLRAQADGVAGLATSVESIGQHLNGIATYLGERARDDGSRAVVLEQRLVTLQNDMTAVGSHVAGLTDAAARNTTGAALAGLEESVRALDARLAASSGDALDSRIRSMVAGALVGTERRLAAHIDEAVLALAEAMLRRRPAAAAEPALAEPAAVEAAQPPPPQPPAPQPAAPPIAPAEVSAPAAPVDLPGAQPLVDPFPVAPPSSAEQAPVAALPEAPPAQPPVEDPPTATEPVQTVDVTDPTVAANAGSNGASANAAGSNGAPKVPTAWTTVMPDDDQRRRGWFRSRD